MKTKPKEFRGFYSFGIRKKGRLESPSMHQVEYKKIIDFAFFLFLEFEYYFKYELKEFTSSLKK